MSYLPDLEQDDRDRLNELKLTSNENVPQAGEKSPSETVQRNKPPRPPGEYDWADERVMVLIDRWNNEFTAREIATEFGCTRSCILGKIHRLKVLKLVKGREDKIGHHKRRAAKQEQAEARNPSVKVVLAAEAPINNLPPDQSAFSCSFFDIKPRQCRWPLSDPGPDFLFCGAECHSLRSYCLRHLKRSERRRVQRVEELRPIRTHKLSTSLITSTQWNDEAA